MAFITTLIVLTHNLWRLPVHLPSLSQGGILQCSHDSLANLNNFDSLVRLLLWLITVSLFGVESIIRSAFYNDNIHCLSSRQWIQPTIISWPHLSQFAMQVGCPRCPSLAK